MNSFEILFLLDFSPIKPAVGLIFWTTVIFSLFWFGIGKLAFKPIINALNKRNDDIQSALDMAKKTKEEMANLKAENERIMQEAREERARMIKEAKDTANAIVTDAKDRAKEEANRIVVNAKNEIETQKKAALVEIKNQVGAMAMDVAEKVIKKELASSNEQQQLVTRLVNEIKMN